MPEQKLCTVCRSYYWTDRGEHVCEPVKASVRDPSYIELYGGAPSELVDLAFVNAARINGAFAGNDWIPVGGAPEMLQKAADTIRNRQVTRDKGQKRSMGKTVAAFNALTGNTLSETDGWVFMAVLKLARAQHGVDPDNYVDGAAYMALAGESAVATKGD